MSRERDALVLENVGLVRHLVAAKFPELVRSSQFDDLVQAGLIGLIQAMDAYYLGTTPIRASFSAYAERASSASSRGASPLP